MESKCILLTKKGFMLPNLCGDRLLENQSSEKPQYRNDEVDVLNPYQDPSSGHSRMWRR